jgi:hypothetical protein
MNAHEPLGLPEAEGEAIPEARTANSQPTHAGAWPRLNLFPEARLRRLVSQPREFD